MVSELLLTVMTAVAGKVRDVPPERTIAPDPEAKVMLLELNVPLNVTVPAPRPVAPLPKLIGSDVVVLMLPGMDEPVASVVHPGIGPGVGAAQVPPAVPNPGVLESLS